MQYIFDLDHTVIDSSHRQLTKADGSLDLDHWIENNTPEKIMADKLLPAAEYMRGKIQAGHKVIICTARVLSQADLTFLFKHGLLCRTILSRPMGDNSRDADLKERLLREYAESIDISFARFASNSLMFDDNKGVLERVKRLGIAGHCAIKFNKILATAA
jgi:FMN phosphatase YigB (HAD superfamily)